MIEDYALKVVILGHYVAYGFTTWYPFRHEGAGITPGGVGFFLGAFITFFLHGKTTVAAPVVIGLPYALAIVIYLCFRKKTRKGPNQQNQPIAGKPGSG